MGTQKEWEMMPITTVIFSDNSNPAQDWIKFNFHPTPLMGKDAYYNDT